MKRYVAIGCTTVHDYSFFLPFVGVMWEKMGYIPIFYLVGDWEEEKAGLVTKHIGRYYKQDVKSIDGIEDATVAQSIRLHAAADDIFEPEDLLIPSDADLIPLKKDFYHSHSFDEKAIGLYYSNGYIGEENDHWPSCHISMRVSTWREVMKLDVGDPRDALIQSFERGGLDEKIQNKLADPKKNWGWVWFFDEHYSSHCIKNSRFFPDGVQFITRRGHPPIDRLDRACWPENYNIKTYTDCHSIRPGWSDSNWPRFRPLLEQACPEVLEWADKYRDKFRELMGCPG